LFLKRLEIVGFKSFATRTVADFAPGIAVIVGPNGSGKSNVADAVRWALGEQSTKAVRARKTEELIFAGTARRQPVGMAEVSLILDNADGSLPIAFAEVRITRRLYRSGETEYLINGSRVRLRDITQQLLHAGLGPDSYCVIGQGAIDELILQRPDERRLAFENAADIRRHHMKLADTRGKLAATEANLARVHDVIAELEPHVRRLKVQADRAQRADRARAELHTLQLTFFRHRLRETRAEHQAAERARREAADGLRVAEERTAAVRSESAAVEQGLDALETRLAAVRPRVDTLRDQARTAERSLAVTRERSAALAEQRAHLTQEIERLSERVDALRGEAAEYEHEGGAAGSSTPEDAATTARLRSRLAELVAALEQVRQAGDGARQARDAADRRILQLEERLASSEQRLRQSEATVAVDEARQSDRRARIEALADSVARLGHDLAAQQDGLKTAQHSLAQAVEERRVAGERADWARESARVVARQADRLQGTLEALGFRPDATQRGAAATTLPSQWRVVLDGLPVVGIAADLAARVRPVDRLVRGYLMRTVVMADAAAAREAHRRLSAELDPAAPAWAVLSADGLLLTALGDRSVVSGADEGTALADWRRQVQQLQAERAAAETARGEAERGHEEAAAWLAAAEEAARAARAAVRDGESSLQAARRAEATTGAELRQHRAALEHAAHDAAALADAQRSHEARTRAAREEVAMARTDRAAAWTRLGAAEENAVSLTAEAEAVRGRIAQLETERARWVAAREARASLFTRLRSDLAAADMDRRAVDERAKQLAAQVRDQAEREVRLNEEVQTATAELAPLQDELRAGADERTALLARRRALDERLAGLRADERAAHEQYATALVRVQRADDEVERLEREMVDAGDLEVDAPGGADWARQLRLALGTPDVPSPDEGDEPAMDVEAVRRRIATVQRELRSVGTVAATVLNEYQELSERHDFLQGQSEDLRRAMAELRQAARELEQTMAERFGRVFEATNAAFGDCFSQLFGGGEARLVLTEPDDLLTSGVDIVARPPDKKLQGLLSLSGGERALTVVALLFGLLKVNPTPFCVLDEVDAALDEANVQRFAEMLGRFAREIHFIVVTHNRATMEQADALYGVTMDGSGVSRVYAVEPRAVAAQGRSVSLVGH